MIPRLEVELLEHFTSYLAVSFIQDSSDCHYLEPVVYPTYFVLIIFILTGIWPVLAIVPI